MPEAGVLYVVATPIGNLEDTTLRAIRVLREVNAIACEDTRVTRKLLAAHGIRTPLVACHAHSGSGVVDSLVGRIAGGESIALVTDAGTPILSDPGGDLVARAIERGLGVVPVPGASAAVAALSAAGLPARAVLFLGFLPRADKKRREILGPLARAPYTLVIYESPKRLKETLLALARTLGDRPACVAREMTKRFETFERGLLAELALRFQEAPLGEVAIVVGPAEEAREQRAPASDTRAEVRRLRASGLAPSEIAKIVAGARGLSREDAYALVLEVEREASEQGTDTGRVR